MVKSSPPSNRTILSHEIVLILSTNLLVIATRKGALPFWGAAVRAESISWSVVILLVSPFWERLWYKLVFGFMLPYPISMNVLTSSSSSTSFRQSANVFDFFLRNCSASTSFVVQSHIPNRALMS